MLMKSAVSGMKVTLSETVSVSGGVKMPWAG